MAKLSENRSAKVRNDQIGLSFNSFFSCQKLRPKERRASYAGKSPRERKQRAQQLKKLACQTVAITYHRSVPGGQK